MSEVKVLEERIKTLEDVIERLEERLRRLESVNIVQLRNAFPNHVGMHVNWEKI